MLNNEQKKIIHIYKEYAGMADPAYRALLIEHAFCSSSADRTFSQSGFDRTMAALETTLFTRFRTGQCPDPRGRTRYIREEFYWRRKLTQPGMINIRQAHQIDKLWSRLQEYLPADKRNLQYFSGIIRQSTGKDRPGATALSHKEAGLLIDALKDRLSYAIRSGEESLSVGARSRSGEESLSSHQPDPSNMSTLSEQKQYEEVPF